MQNPQGQSSNNNSQIKRQTQNSLPSIVPLVRIVDVKNQTSNIHDEIFYLRGRINNLKNIKTRNQKKAIKSVDKIRETQIQRIRFKEIKNKQSQRKQKKERQREELCKKISQYKSNLIKQRQRAKDSLKMQKLYQANQTRTSKRRAQQYFDYQKDISIHRNKQRVAKIKKEEENISSNMKQMRQTMYQKGQSLHNDKVKNYLKQKSKDLKLLRHLKKQESKLLIEAQQAGERAQKQQTNLKKLKLKNDQNQQE